MVDEVRRPVVIVVIACASLLTARDAHACGAAYPGGPVMCDYPRVVAQPAPIVRMSASYATTRTTLLFGSGRRADLTRHAIFGGLEAPLSRRLTMHFGAGGIAGGTLGASEMGPGFTGFAGVGGRVVDEKDAWPFVQVTATLSGSHALTRAEGTSERYTAFDLRLGAMAGKTFARTVTPYAVVRAFGGPVYWRFEGERVTGTDLYKYQVGAGVSLALFDRRLDVFVEGIALGERTLACGIGTTFF